MAEDTLGRLMAEPEAVPVSFNPLRLPYNAAKSVLESLMSLPGRLYGAADEARTEGTYDPAPALEAASLTMGATPFSAPRGAIGAGPIRAYHGSPYDFERFDLSKIGTGEGAQAYGHGLYFAGNENVARSYRDALSGSRGAIPGAFVGRYKWLVGPEGEQLPAGISGHRALDTAQDIDALLYHEKRGGDLGMRKYLREKIENRIDRERSENEAMVKGGYELMGSAYDDMRALSDFYDRHLRGGKTPEITERPPGRMYEVNINADPAHLLDWDRRVGEQSDKVYDALYEAGLRPHLNEERVAGDLYSLLQHGHYNPAYLSEQLRDVGIPGIKYLDQGSRGAGAGTSNYVVFDDKLIDILRKYGLAGASPLAALMASGGEQPQQ